MSDGWMAQLSALRRGRGLKQAAVAAMLGVDQATVSRWETGKQEPDLAARARLRDLLWRYGSRFEADLRGLMASPLANRTLMSCDQITVAVSAEAARVCTVPIERLIGLNIRDIRADPRYDQLVDENYHLIRMGEFVHFHSRFRSRLSGWIETYTVPVVLGGRVHLLAERHHITDPARQRQSLEILAL